MVMLTMRKTYVILFLFVLAVIKNVSLSRIRACVIGAGPAGLISTRFLAAYLNKFEPIVFEKNSDVGGLWIYTDSTTDKHGLPVHSSVYRDLRINGPKELLRYPDFEPIYGGNSSFVTHATILEYLKKYTEHFNLRQYIQFDTNVEKVSLLSNDSWLIRARDLNTRIINQVPCAALIIANGHFVKEFRPEIPGIDTFPGLIIHSHLYRKPEIFYGKTVVVLGASFSGMDIAIQISSHAKKVYLSSKYPKSKANFPANVEKILPVIEAMGNTLILSDSSVIEDADAFVFCTGYLFDFPFLHANSKIVVENGKYVKPLYKDLINIEHPTMAILNIPNPGFPLLMPYAQVQYFLAVLLHKVELPSREKMLEDSKILSGRDTCKAHQYADFEQILSYYNQLSTKGGGQPLPPYFMSAIEAYWPHLQNDPMHFREKHLIIHDDNSVDFV